MLIAHLIFLSLSSGIFAHPTAEDQIDFINEDANPNVVAYVPEATENKAVEQNNDFTISLAAGTSPAEQAPAEPAKDPSCPTDTPYPMTCGGPEVQASEETKEILNCDSGKFHGRTGCLLIWLLEFLNSEITAKSSWVNRIKKKYINTGEISGNLCGCPSLLPRERTMGKSSFIQVKITNSSYHSSTYRANFISFHIVPTRRILHNLSNGQTINFMNSIKATTFTRLVRMMTTSRSTQALKFSI